MVARPLLPAGTLTCDQVQPAMEGTMEPEQQVLGVVWVLVRLLIVVAVALSWPFLLWLDNRGSPWIVVWMPAAGAITFRLLF